MPAGNPIAPCRAALARRGCAAAMAVLTSLVPLAFAQSSPASSRLPARAPEASAEAPVVAAAKVEGPMETGVVNLNTASIDELTRLPGIGPTKARAVLELRRKLTRFSRLEDLMRVKGIGRKTFRKLQPLIRLSGTTTLQDPRERSCPRGVTRVVRGDARSARA
jgi:competence protein ComEA